MAPKLSSITKDGFDYNEKSHLVDQSLLDQLKIANKGQSPLTPSRIKSNETSKSGINRQKSIYVRQNIKILLNEAKSNKLERHEFLRTFL